MTYYNLTLKIHENYLLEFEKKFKEVMQLNEFQDSIRFDYRNADIKKVGVKPDKKDRLYNLLSRLSKKSSDGNVTRFDLIQHSKDWLKAGERKDLINILYIEKKINIDVYRLATGHESERYVII